MLVEYTGAEVKDLLEQRRSSAIVECRVNYGLVGGLPATGAGLEAFVKHHLKLDPDSKAFTEAVQRIAHEEVGERETTPEGGEVPTSEVYAVNNIRYHRGIGPYIMGHQVIALLKQSASRLGIYSQRKGPGGMGSRGDIAEFGSVLAAGVSLQEPDRPWNIHLRNSNGGGRAVTEWHKLSGTVNTSQGKKAIMHHSEVALAGTLYSWEFRWPGERLDGQDIALIVAGAAEIGQGSCLSLGYGEFEILKLTVNYVKPPSLNRSERKTKAKKK